MGRVSHIRHPSLVLLAVFIVLVSLVSAMVAGENQEEEDDHRIREVEKTLVNNSYIFFCDKIIDSDTSLAGATIVFEGKTTTAYSPVIYIADCAGDIDMVTNHIPNRDYINRLQAHYDELPPEYSEVTDMNKRTKKFVLLPGKKNICYLNIYRPIHYKGKYYVLFYILFEREQKLFYSFSLDDDFEVIDFCTKRYLIKEK
jgi:hypothetical protein